MCDVLVTADGIELSSIAQVRRYGVAVPASAEHPYHGAAWCLCNANLKRLLAKHPSAWRYGHTAAGLGWSEVGIDGRTWEDGFDVTNTDPAHPRIELVTRSDGRHAMTLEQWETSHG